MLEDPERVLPGYGTPMERKAGSQPVGALVYPPAFSLVPLRLTAAPRLGQALCLVLGIRGEEEQSHPLLHGVHRRGGKHTNRSSLKW